MSNFKEEWSILQEKKKEILSKRFLTKLVNNVSIYLINGKYVRNHLETDFIGGGHHYVPYKFIPENEIWIENIDEGEREVDAIILHEFTERMLMKYMNFEYEDAHNIATKYENKFRMKEKNDPHRISDILNEYFNKYFTNDHFYNKDFSNKTERNIIDIKL